MRAADRRRLQPGEAPSPRYVVWEITLRCNQPCAHCGSRAGEARARELDTAEALGVVDQLAALQTREVTLIGGEAWLRPDIHRIIEAIAAHGIVVNLQTGGRGLSRARLQALRDAGLCSLGVSVDGPEGPHDLLRGNRGSWASAMRTLELAAELGIPTASNTQVNRLTADHLWETSAALRDRRVRSWRGQLTVPMGNAADQEAWILEPWRVVDVINTLAAIQVDAALHRRPHEHPRPFNVRAANNLGYFGPHEVLLRSDPGGGEDHWRGCGAGVAVLGIESDGTIKACPSLPTAPYAGGNVLDLPLAQAWEQPELRFAREPDRSELWGFCATCIYAEVCRAGCNFTAHATLGRRGNNPFCYHRVTTLAQRGRRERLVKVEDAAGRPYDFGRFEVVEEEVLTSQRPPPPAAPTAG
jgi:radical SAM protein with 4Fe4S-binding SPASM domain